MLLLKEFHPIKAYFGVLEGFLCALLEDDNITILNILESENNQETKLINSTGLIYGSITAKNERFINQRTNFGTSNTNPAKAALNFGLKGCPAGHVELEGYGILITTEENR